MDAITGADIRAYILGRLDSMAAFHDRESGYGDTGRHREAADDLWTLIDKLAALPEDHPAFVKLAAICVRTECHCQKKDDRISSRRAGPSRYISPRCPVATTGTRKCRREHGGGGG